MARVELAPLQPPYDWQKNLYRALEKDFELESGEMDEYPRALATSKTVVEAISAGRAHRYIMFESTLPKHLSEAIGVLVSSKNRCSYCADAHTRSLEVDHEPAVRAQWASEFVDHVQRRNIGHLPGYGGKDRELLMFVDQASRRPEQRTTDDFEDLHQQGFSRRELLDALAAVALFEMHNRMVIALDLSMTESYRRYELSTLEESLPIPGSRSQTSSYRWFMESNGEDPAPEAENLFEFARGAEPDPYRLVIALSTSCTKAIHVSHGRLRDRSVLAEAIFESIGIVAGDVLSCPYLRSLHEQGLRVSDPDLAKRLLPHPMVHLERLDPREQAVLKLARGVLRAPGSLDDSSFRALRSERFTGPQILEIAATAGIFAMDASMISSLGLTNPFE